MRIVFLAVDDEFAGAMQQCVYARHPEWVAGSVISTSTIYKKGTLGSVGFIIKQCGLLYLAEMAWMKLVKKMLSPKDMALPGRLAIDARVEIFRSSDINDDPSLAKLASWKPDLVISTNFNHYIGKQARRIATLGTWNLHKALLPEHRGMAPSFFALLESCEYTGITLHKVEKGFDTGPILVQEKFPIERSDTVYSLNKRASEKGGQILVHFLEQLDPGNIKPTPQPSGDWHEYTYPNRRQVRAFLAKGRRF